LQKSPHLVATGWIEAKQLEEKRDKNGKGKKRKRGKSGVKR